MFVFSRRMPKRRAGFWKGWYARRRRSLVEQMRRLTIQETAPLPTAQQIQALLQMAYAGYFEYDYDHDRRRWIVDIPSITKSTGDARRVNGTRPKDIPFCGLGVEGRYIAVPWKLCRDETATVYSNDTHSLWDWLPDSNRNPRREGSRQFSARIWNLGGTTVYQTEIWKLLAAFRTDGSLLQTGGKTKGGLSWRAHWWNEPWKYPRTCVPYPFMILVGSVTLSKNASLYHVHCFNCTLTHCIRGMENNSGALIVKQQPFIMMPVNLTKPWYE